MFFGSWSRTGAYEDVPGTPADFVIAVEESHGILTTPQIRDKDAGGAALLLAELALDQKRRGQTVLDYLDRLAREFGYFHNDGVPVFMTRRGGQAADGAHARPSAGDAAAGDRRPGGDATSRTCATRRPVRPAQGGDRRRVAQRAGLPLRRPGARGACGRAARSRRRRFTSKRVRRLARRGRCPMTMAARLSGSGRTDEAVVRRFQCARRCN